VIDGPGSGEGIMAKSKSNHCWSCAARLDQPYNGVMPESHGCGQSDCVRCPKCGSGICEYDPAGKTDREGKAARIKGMATGVARGNAASPGGPGGSGGDPRDAKDYLPAVDPFPVQVLPTPLQQYVQEVATAFGCPADFAALPVLVNAAAAIGGAREIELKDSYRTSAALFAGIIAEPGATKTPVLKSVSRPLDRRQEDLLVQFRSEWAQYAEEQTARDQEERRAKKARKKDGGSSVANPDDDIVAMLKRFDDSKKPVLQRITTSDTTVEALCLLLSENPRGLLLKRDELVAWVRGMDMYRKGKGTDRQFYMSAYSSAPFVLDRKSNAGRIPILVARPFLCVIGCLPPQMLAEFEDEQGREDGFVDRILWVYPDVVKYVPWTEADVSEDARRAWEACLQKLWSLQGYEERGRYAPKAVGLIPAAKKAWVEFYNGITAETAADDFPARLVGPWLKLRDYGARLALVIHELRCACGECHSEEMVEEVSVQAAAELVCYFRSHAIRVHAAMAAKTELTEADAALVEAVEKLVVASDGRWSGNSQKLLADLTPHAGEALKLPRWPTSPAGMGHAIRRVAGHLTKGRGICVTLPAATDKTRTLILQKQTPKPPIPPADDGTSSVPTGCDSGGSGQSEAATAQTAQEDNAARADWAVESGEVSKPPEPQDQQPERVAESEGGLGGLGGSAHDSEDVEDNVV
jgi:hypothetical protein